MLFFNIWALRKSFCGMIAELVMNSRCEKIFERLASGGVRIQDLAEEFGVTTMTIRRDLRELESRQLALLVKGGAVRHPACYEPETVTIAHPERKAAIAQALYRRILPTPALFLGTGTTTLMFARLMARFNRYRLTVVTNSLPVASALFRSKCKVILLGGELRTSSMDLVGAVAEKTLQEYHVEWLVTGCDAAVATDGFYTADVNLSNLERLSITMAHRVAVITDSTKFGRPALTRFASPDDVDLLVTDDALSASDAEVLRSRHVEIILVRSS